MILRALKRGFSPVRPVLDENGDKVWMTAKVRKGQEFEFHGDESAPPRWCTPVDEEAKTMYELAYPDKPFPVEEPEHVLPVHPALRGKKPAKARGAGSGIAGLGDAGVM